jgi:hypothetical protein
MQSLPAEALTPKEFVARVLRFASQPTPKNWYRLTGTKIAYESPGAGEHQKQEIARHAAQLQDALLAIIRGSQTAKEIKAWRDATAGIRAIPTFVIEGKKVRTKLSWWMPLEALDLPALPGLPECIPVAMNTPGILAAALMMLLDPDQPFYGRLRECGRGPACDRDERFHLKKRRYCCRAHWPDRKADWRERRKAASEIAKQLPNISMPHARKLVTAVSEQGLKCEELVRRAISKQKADDRPSAGSRKSR